MARRMRLWRFLCRIAILLPLLLFLGEVVARVGNLPGVSRWRDPVLLCMPTLTTGISLFQRHPVYLWTLVPNSGFYSSDSRLTRNLINIDGHGFRKTLWEDSGDDGIRWMFLGDSMVFCWGAPTGETFPDAVVNIVHDRYGIRTTASFNLGIPAHSSYQSLRILQKEFLRVRPDIVVFWGGSNDNARTTGCSDRQFAKLYGGAMFYVRLALDKSAFIRWTRTLRPSTGDSIEIRSVATESEAPRRVESIEFRNNVREMANYAMRHGARFLAIIREHVGRREALADYNSMLKQLEKEDLLDVVDIGDIYSVALDEGLMRDFPADRCHFNAGGYRRVAAEVAERIAAQGWIDTFLEKKRSSATAPLNRAG